MVRVWVELDNLDLENLSSVERSQIVYCRKFTTSKTDLRLSE